MEEKKNSKKGVKKGNTTTKKSTTTKKTSTKVATKTTAKKVSKNSTNANKKNSTVKKVVENKKPVVKKETTEAKKTETNKIAKKDNCFKKVRYKICNALKKFNNKCEEDKPFFITFIICLILIITIICLVVFGRIPKTKDGNDILAKLDGKTITADDLYIELKDQYGVNALVNAIDEFIAEKEVTSKDDIETAKNYAKEAIDYYKEYAEYYGVDFETFLTSYIGISSVTDEDSFYDYIFKDYKKTLAVKKYIGESFTDKEVKDYYNENYSKLISVREILIEIEDDKEDEAKEKVAELIAELDKVKNDKDKLTEKFKDLAYDNSDYSTYSDGGLKENLKKSEVSEEFWKAADELKNGKYTTEAIKDEYGYHIILKVSESKGKDLKEVESEIRNTLAEEALNNDSNLQVTSWDKLRKKYNLKIYDKNIKKAYKNTITSYHSSSSTEEDNSTETEEE